MPEPNEILDEMNDAAALKPILEGVEKIAKFTTEKANEAEKGLKKLREEVVASMKGADEKAEKMANDIIDRIDALSKRFSASGRFNVEQDDIAEIKGAIPERFKKNWNSYEMISTKDGVKPTYDQVVKTAVQHAYFNEATKVQLRQFASERSTLEPELFGFTDKLNKISKADLYGSTNASGGYAVPDIVGNEVLKIVRDASLIYSRARQLPMTSDTLSFPDEATAVTINWVAEGGALTGGEPVFGVKTLTAKKIAGRAVMGMELLDDANVAILPFSQSCFAEKFGGELDFQSMEGPGTVFTGVAFAVGVNDCARTNGTNGVVLSYSSSTATIASLVQVFTKAGEGMTRSDGIFVCGPGVYSKIIGLVDNNQQPVVRLGTVEGQPNNTLFGRPIIVSNRLPAYTVGAGTVSVGALYFGPPSALLFGTRAGMQWNVTDQVHWSNYQADARLIGRFAYVTGVPTAWAMQRGIII